MLLVGDATKAMIDNVDRANGGKSPIEKLNLNGASPLKFNHGEKVFVIKKEMLDFR